MGLHQQSPYAALISFFLSIEYQHWLIFPRLPPPYMQTLQTLLSKKRPIRTGYRKSQGLETLLLPFPPHRFPP